MSPRITDSKLFAKMAAAAVCAANHKDRNLTDGGFVIILCLKIEPSRILEFCRRADGTSRGAHGFLANRQVNSGICR